jgi:hypothetical protein
MEHQLNNAYDVAREAQRSADLAKTLSEARRKAMASGLVEQVAGQIREFEASLDAAHLPGIIVRGDLTLLLEQIGFHDPGLMLFIGRDGNGQPARVLQHMSQLNIALVAIPRENTEEPKNPIGFELPRESEAER